MPGNRRARQGAHHAALRVESFFAAYPRFLETSETSAELGRLDLRYHAIFRENADVFRGARVLDIASHDGRWSFAALATGAAHVTGIEARPELVAAASDNLAHYGVDPSRYRFLAGDVFDALAGETLDVDVVLCLGYLYHTLRYNELLRRIRDLHPTWVIVDTAVSRAKGPLVRLVVENTERQGNAAVDRWSWNERALVGWPTVDAVKLMLDSYDFPVDGRTRWRALVKANPHLSGVEDYGTGRRITVRARSRSQPLDN